jgi:hypothetical protein
MLYANGVGRRQYVAHLVASAFIGPRPDGYVVCHGPKGKTDNSVSNISYGSQSKNVGVDRRRDGTLPHGESHYQGKLNNQAVASIRYQAANGASRPYLASFFGVSQATIADVITHKTWATIT